MRPFSFGRPPGRWLSCMFVLESISVYHPFEDQDLTATCCRTWGCNPSVHRYTQFWFSWCPGTLESLSVCSGAKRSHTGRSMPIEHAASAHINIEVEIHMQGWMLDDEAYVLALLDVEVDVQVGCTCILYHYSSTRMMNDDHDTHRYTPFYRDKHDHNQSES